MKRCSQCDFIYEDDQNLCDMDGHALVHEPTLQALHVIASKAASRLPSKPVKSRAGRPALLAGASLLIGTVLSVGYFGFTRTYAPQNTKAPSTNFIQAPKPAPEQTPASSGKSPTPSPAQSPTLEETPVREKTPVSPTTSPSLARAAPRMRTTAPRPDTRSSQSANHKKEKGIGGFLKKTGRILKKPFKF